MRACDHCQSTESVERASVRIQTESGVADAALDLCRDCLSKLGSIANTTLRPLQSAGLGYYASAVPAASAPVEDAGQTAPAASEPASTETSQAVSPAPAIPEDVPPPPTDA